jgi:hypothetical protein
MGNQLYKVYMPETDERSYYHFLFDLNTPQRTAKFVSRTSNIVKLPQKMKWGMA